MAEAMVQAEAIEPTVRIRHLQHFFGAGAVRHQALFDITMDLMPGEIVIMTGPSGSGKTTLLTLIGALRSVQEGSVQISGRELRGLSNPERVAVRRNVGFIFQAHNLFSSLSAYHNVMLALELQRQKWSDKPQRVVNMLTRLGLEHRIHYKPRAMSGGQRQRVAVARALVHQPPLILADEPTAALDKEAGQQVVTLLQELAHESRTTVLIVTHDNRILDVADRIVNMVDGHIVSNVALHESVTICEFLLQCPTFSSFALSTLSRIADKMTQEQHPAGTVIIRQGDEGDKFYLIKQGTVEVLIEDGGTQRHVAVLTTGKFFGEMALLSGQPRNATVQAQDDVHLYTLDKGNFEMALALNETFKEQITKIVFQRQ
jgi:putative ABC transport system ATP-binding protein